jgi:hypothetical protein
MLAMVRCRKSAVSPSSFSEESLVSLTITVEAICFRRPSSSLVRSWPV